MAKNEYAIGKYRVLEEIASGSSGRVYRAEDPKHKNMLVAIKLLHSASLSSEQERDHFLQEARFLTLLKHPNILPVLDVGIEKNLPYIVTEFAPNGSLLDYLKKLAPRPLPASEALSIVLQVGQALQYAHSQNIIHRDLKPANILFSANGTAMLADFGITTMLANNMQYGTVTGTPSYMAPEQFRGTISKEGDQYALGCITYELVTGRRPFSAADFFTLGTKHMSETPIPPTQLNMLLSRSLEQVIFKAMAKKRNERYPTIAAFNAALGGGVQLPLSSASTASTYALSRSQLPPLPPPPVAIINATTLPSATPAAAQLWQAVQTPVSPSLLQQSVQQPQDGYAIAPRSPILSQPTQPAWQGPQTPNEEDASDETFKKPAPAEADSAHWQVRPAIPVIPPSSTQPPVMRLDKNMPVRPFSPADSLPRALNGSNVLLLICPR